MFVGGAKLQGGKISDQTGVLEERDVASHLGKFLLPVGRSGGSAAIIARELIGSSVPFNGPKARRPSDKELIALQDEGDPGKLAKIVAKILKRKSSGLD